ncbi:unnamed protein product, partial [Ascophyllum nodosum]
GHSAATLVAGEPGGSAPRSTDAYGIIDSPDHARRAGFIDRGAPPPSPSTLSTAGKGGVFS